MKQFLGFGIIGIVSLIMLASASTVIWAGVSDKHSSPRFVAYEVGRLERYVRERQGVEAIESMPQLAEQPTASPAGMVAGCSTNSEIASNQKRRSLVNYLVSRGQQASYEARVELAKANNLPDYRGTAKENVQLLTILQTKDNEAAAGCVTVK